MKYLFNRILVIFTVVLPMVTILGCNQQPDKLFYKRAYILDIKRDDESQYHLLVRYMDGSAESVADVHCKLIMGDKYCPFAEMPFVNWDNGDKKGILKGWEYSSSIFSGMPIIVYLPLDYKIELIND